jgi:C4-dicarboxylate transporter, DctM subunit
MSATTVAVLSLVLMLLLIWGGLHVAVVLGLVSFVGVWIIRGDVGVAANLLAQASSDAIASHIFGVVPLFVLTGFLVAKADIGKDAFEVANQLFRRLRGGLGVATVASNAVFAAITGISIASAAVFTRVAVPQMMRFGYQPQVRGGRGGRLVGAGHADPAQPADDPLRLPGQPVGGRPVHRRHRARPAAGAGLAVGIVDGGGARHGVTERGPVPGRAGHGPGTMLLKLLPIVLMIGGVLGGLYGGLFTATEAGAVGAALALLIAVLRRKLTARPSGSVLTETGHVTVAVSFLIICASIYTRMLAMSGMPQFLMELIGQAGLGRFAFLLVYVLIVIAAGHRDRLVLDPADRAAADAADRRAVRHEPDLVRRGHRGGGGDRPAHTAVRAVRLRGQEHAERPAHLAGRHLPRHGAVHADDVRCAAAADGLPAAEPGAAEMSATSNPLDGFTVDRDARSGTSAGPAAPECILAERDGTLWAADARGGVTRIAPDGRQRFIGQRADERFATSAEGSADASRPSTPRARCPTAWPSPPTATS